MAHSNKSDCLEDIKGRILSLDFAPGSDLDEASLSTRYGLSRTPLREILQRLAGEGYITLISNRGAKVASMDWSVLRTFFQTAPTIYANIAFLAAQNRNAAQLQDLKEIQSEFVQATTVNAPDIAALSNYQFHKQIGLMAANPYLMASLNRLLIDHTRLSQTFYRPADPEETALVDKAVSQHDAMIAAIEKGESSLAMDLTLQHWDLSRDRLERFVHAAPLPANIVDFKGHKHAV